MKYLSDVGFVIKRVNVGEADRYLTLFTRNHGKIEVAARGVRKITSRRAGAVELLNLIEFHAVEGAHVPVLTETKLLSSCSHLKSDFSKVPQLFLICELIDKLCPENQRHEDIFNLMFQTLKRINIEDGQDNLLQFQIRLLSILGFWDDKREFKDAAAMNSYIENILERKIKTRMVFEV